MTAPRNPSRGFIAGQPQKVRRTPILNVRLHCLYQQSAADYFFLAGAFLAFLAFFLAMARSPEKGVVVPA